jgi:acyl-CoA hydrolase
MDWTKLADDSTVENTAQALRKRGIEAIVVDDGESAKKKIFELIPKGAEVMQMTSATLKEIGIAEELEQTDEYESVRKKIMEISDEKQRNDMRRKSLSPDYAIGSVHAVTQDGQILVASGSGSQLPAYVFGAANVIFVVGTQKIVKDLNDGLMRIYEHSLPLESERVKKEYGMPRSMVNKILILEGERPGRIKLIFVKQKLGF